MITNFLKAITNCKVKLYRYDFYLGKFSSMTHNQRVGGSSPSGPTKSPNFVKFWGFVFKSHLHFILPLIIFHE